MRRRIRNNIPALIFSENYELRAKGMVELSASCPRSSFVRGCTTLFQFLLRGKKDSYVFVQKLTTENEGKSKE